MKDIDLLPEWYKSGQRRQQSLHSQYLVVAGAVAIILVWNFVTARSVSTAQARFDARLPGSVHAQAVIEHRRQLSERIEKLSKKAALLDAIDSKIDVARVLSELSFLVDARIVLSDVSFGAKAFDVRRDSPGSGGGVRVAVSGASKAAAGHLGDVRFEVVVRGIADQTSDVGKLVRRLEESEYFCNVSLAFSRNKTVKVSGAEGDNERRVSEFEISCDLANYRLK